jgi:hypothetical protein
VHLQCGNPAVIGIEPLDRKLCVPIFRSVCVSRDGPFETIPSTVTGTSRCVPRTAFGAKVMGGRSAGLRLPTTDAYLATPLSWADAFRPVALRPCLSTGLPFAVGLTMRHP